MKKTCLLTGKEFEITEHELVFLKKINLPPPKYSPKAREIMRLAFRSERTLHMRKCDKTGERMLSVYRANASFPVYKYDYWMSEEWEAPSLPYDKNKGFFEQYAELSALTPRPNGFSPYNENCDYVNAAEKNRNCYMHILADRCEDCYYVHGGFGCRDCIDCAYIYDSELCFEANDCRKCYHCRMCFLCDNSSELSFCMNLRGCSNCFMCSNMQNQSYCFFDKQLTREKYEEEMAKIDLGSYEEFSKYENHFMNEIVEKGDYTRMINTENSDGNFLINVKNCHQCYDVEDAEDCHYVRISANGVKDVHHTHAVVDGSQLIYCNVSTTESYNCHNIIGCWTTKDSAYGEFLQGCKNCLGCISLRYKKNCILNKEYSEDEFKELKKHIMDELGDDWGQPFPLSIAPLSYLDCAYSDYHEMTKEEVEAIGWVYGEKDEMNKGESQPVIEIPDNSSDFADETASAIYSCAASGRPFRITRNEALMLQKLGAPLPRKHFETRFKERTKFHYRAA